LVERVAFWISVLPIYLVSSTTFSCKMQAENQFSVEEGKALAVLASSEASNNNSRTRTVIVDSRGDLTLGTGLSDTGDCPAQCFRVCSRTLARTSPVLERMLYGSFAESNSQRETDWTIDLPEVKPAPFALLAFICHGLFDKAPKVLSTDELFDLIILTHYYDCTPVLAPWTERWLASIREPASIRELEMYKVLFISQELGDKRTFEITARRLVLESRETAERDELHDQLGGHMIHIVDRIDAIRDQTIEAMLVLFRELTDILVVVDEKPRWCKYASYMGPHRCESMILGSVVFCLTRAGLWPIPDPRDVGESVMGLYRKMTGVVIHDIGQVEKNGNDHARCNPRNFLLERLQRILVDITDPLVQGEREYVVRQRQRQRLETGAGS
jgi:hypothetical protein